MLLAAWILLAPAARAEPSPGPAPLTLAQAQRLALARHPAPRAAAQGVRQAELAATDAYFGLASLTGDIGGAQRFERSGIGPPLEGISRDQTLQFELRLRVPIFNGGLTGGQIGRAEADLAQRRVELAQARLDVLFDVTSAYWEAKRQDILYRVAEETLKQSQETYNFSRVRLQAGAAAPIDFNRVEVNLINTRDAATRASGQLDSARERLAASLFGPTAAFGLADEPQLLAPPPLAEALALAQRQRPEVQRVVLAVRAREYDVRIAEAGLWPTLAVDAGYRWGNEVIFSQGGTSRLPLARNLLGEPSSTLDAGLTLQYRFWDNGATLRRAASAAAAVAGAREQLAIARRDAERDVRQAYISLEIAAARARNLERAVAIARDNLRIMNLRYRLGVALVIELSDVQASLSQTLTNRANALIDYNVARATLARAAGAEDWLLPASP